MKKELFFMAVLLFSLGAVGCSSVGKKVDENTINVDLMKGRIADINEELNELGVKLNNLQAHISKSNARVGVTYQREEAPKRTRQSPAGRILTKKVEEAPRPKSRSAKPTVKSAALKIKILSGDDNIASARALKTKLKTGGYVVERVDLSPSMNRGQHKIFYASGFKQEAARIADVLGGGAITRPLTWKSVFNIIIVSGRGG